MLPISPDYVERIKRSAFTGDDIFGGLAPDEGLRLGVMLQEVVVDRAFEIVDAAVAATSDALCLDLGEEALDQVHPGCAGGREMQLKARMFLQPGKHLGRLVGCVVVEHQMDVAGLFTARSMRRRKVRNSFARWRGMHSPMTRPDLTSSAAKSVVVPWRL